MKAQIDTFYSQLKEKARDEEEKRRSLKLEQEQKQRLRARLHSAASDVFSVSNHNMIEMPSIDGRAIKASRDDESELDTAYQYIEEEAKAASGQSEISQQ